MNPTPLQRLREKLAAVRGAGDAVALVAQPVARAIDKVAGTDLANCKPCIGPGGRKDQLNALFPFGGPDPQ